MRNAEAVLRAKCEAGNGDACLNMGFHILGLATINRASRVPIDYKKRFLQFKKNADEAKQEVEVLRQKSVEFFKRGCSLGNGEACYFVWEYEQPISSALSQASPPAPKVWQNNEWLKRSGDAAYKACLDSTEVDADTAFKCYQSGRWLMMSNDFQRGVIAYTRAIIGLRKACDAGDAPSCFILSQSDITQDAREENAVRACKLGNSTACLTNGLRALDNHKVEDARALLQQACEQAKDGGHPGACYRLAMMHATGDRLPEDNTRAFHYFRQACKLGDAQSCEYELQFEKNKSFGLARKPETK